MPDQQLLTVGLIGAGPMGRHLAQVTHKLPNCKVGFVCDPDQQHARETAQELDAEITASLEELLGHDGLDAVIIASPNYLHAQQTVAAAQAGKHIFCEKPMALNVADVRQMIEAASLNGVKLMIGQVLRYIVPFVWIIEFIAAGNLGKPFGMQVTRIGGPWGGSYGQSWRIRRNECGGPLLEIGAHEIDFIRCILGEATSVFARLEQFLPTDIDYEDFASVMISFQNGHVAQLLEGHSSYTGIYDGRIFCTEGTLMFDRSRGDLAYQRKGDDEPTIVAPADFEGKYENPQQRELREFFEAIRTDTDPTIPGIEGLRNVEIAEAARLSHERGEPVSLPL